MNISQLSAFHAVMTSATLTEAADRLGRTQPAISAAIRSLEDQLGMKLFERRGRKLVPVPEAQYLMTEASAILRQLSQVRQTMRGLGDGHLGTLTVAAMPGPVTLLFPRFIATHIGKGTGSKISMLARSSNQIAELARAQSIDFGFADIPEDADGGGLYRSDVISGNCFVALPATHALAREKTISLDALSGQAMGSLQANHVHTRDVRRAFEEAGHKFNPMVESQTFLPILPFVVAGQCCAILDPLTVVHVWETGIFSETLSICLLDRPLRYSYAIISPAHRPTSVIATEVRNAWTQEVRRLLESASAHPELRLQEQDAMTSS